ncbi:hypothetical protein LguiB_017312 [Lonicera macranthoides]
MAKIGVTQMEKLEVFGHVPSVVKGLLEADDMGWRSFRNLVDEKPQPLDFSSSPHCCTTTLTTTGSFVLRNPIYTLAPCKGQTDFRSEKSLRDQKKQQQQQLERRRSSEEQEPPPITTLTPE